MAHYTAQQLRPRESFAPGLALLMKIIRRQALLMMLACGNVSSEQSCSRSRTFNDILMMD